MREARNLIAGKRLANSRWAQIALDIHHCVRTDRYPYPGGIDDQPGPIQNVAKLFAYADAMKDYGKAQ